MKLGDLVSIKHGFAFKGEFFSTHPTQYVLLTPGNFHIGGGFKSDKNKYYNGPIPSEYILKQDDLIVTMTDLSKEGDTLGYSALIPSDLKQKYLHNQRIGLVQINKPDLLDKHYLYWFLVDMNFGVELRKGHSPVFPFLFGHVGDVYFCHIAPVGEHVQPAFVVDGFGTYGKFAVE